MRVAAVDIGTNTVRLLIADAAGGRLVDLERRVVITRLGQGVDRIGLLHADAMARTLAALEEYGKLIDGSDVDRRRAVATSASRDAANSADFMAEVSRAVGVSPEVIGGMEEARLSFRGAVAGPAGTGAATATPLVVIDVGGGSTEFVAGTTQPVYAISVDTGSVRLTERHLGANPAPPNQVAAARAHVAELFSAELQLPPVADVIGVAGTYTALAAMHLLLAAYDPIVVEGSVLTVTDLAAMVESLATMTVDQIAAIPSMVPARAPVMLGGAIVAEQALIATGHNALAVSESDILDGIALSLLDG